MNKIKLMIDGLFCIIQLDIIVMVTISKDLAYIVDNKDENHFRGFCVDLNQPMT